ncbi:MAG TPA: AI-2E family transporter [Verrucomicrobiae bacterium]|nr:AI-2E family transporter [Verrucomicrobiae bacterium]
MAIDYRTGSSSRNTTLLAVVVVVAILYFARLVLIPFALAVLISFLLAPLVTRLRRWHFGRVPSVLCVVALAFALVVVVAGLVSVQLGDLARKLPEYQENIQKKMHSVRDSSSGIINRLSRAVHSITRDLTPATPSSETPGEEKPVPVEIRQNAFAPIEIIRKILGSLLGVLFTAGIVIVFVIFMLVQREDLRDRLIRLVGSGKINITTTAMDDAGNRLSRYLLAQLALNASFGVLVGIGLFFLKVPNPILWAVLAALLRYVPYLGIWVAAAMPAAVALATNPGWLEPLAIFGLFVGIDIVALNFAEPLVYGNSTGISPLAILAAAVFWTWLWGPIGLLLATPLTVCVVVVGRYVPSLEFLSILLGDEPVLSPEKQFYQRLLGMNMEEATEVAESFLKQRKSLEELFDGVIVPALALAEADRHRGKLDDEHSEFIFENARMLVEDIAERSENLISGVPVSESSPDSKQTEKTEIEKAIVLSMPARDEADEIGALMLELLLSKHGVAVKTTSASALASERLQEAGDGKIQIVCVTAVPPFGYLHARYLCKRLRAQYPEVKVVAAILNQQDAREVQAREPRIPAHKIAPSLRLAVSMVLSLVLPAESSPKQTAFSA